MKVPLTFLVVLLALSGVLSACIYVPPVWDIGDDIHDVDEIEVGVTTRQEVLDLLGEPDTKTDDGSTFRYHGETSSGWVVYGGVLASAPGGHGLLGPDEWWIEIEFEKDGVVRRLWHSRDEASVEAYGQRQQERREREWAELGAQLREQADQGDVSAQRRYAINHASGQERIDYLCRAARQGDAQSQHDLGREMRPGEEAAGVPVPRDPTRAYMWFTIASNNGRALSRYHGDKLAETMTPAQIAEGERLAAEWTPESPCP